MKYKFRPDAILLESYGHLVDDEKLLKGLIETLNHANSEKIPIFGWSGGINDNKIAELKESIVTVSWISGQYPMEKDGLERILEREKELTDAFSDFL